MRKTQRAPLTKGKGKASGKGGKPSGRKSTPERIPARERIPVRGASKPAGKAGNKAGGKAAGKASSRAGSKAGKSKVATRAAAEQPPRRQTDAELAETRKLALAAMEAALDKHGLEPVLIDVSSMGSYTDFIGIVSGRSDRQVDAIADNVCSVLKSRGHHVLGQEGTGSGRWTLLDFGSFVVHVFYHPVREFYDLESLWIEAPRVKMHVPPEATLAQSDALYGAL